MIKKIIIVVDDDEDILNLFKHFLKDEYSEVIVLNCALKALELLRFKKVDLIITDILMPNMNGIEFTKNVQSQFPDLPVLVCSEGGSTEARDIVASIVMNKAIFFGATYALKKPFSKSDLLATTKAIVTGNIEELDDRNSEDAS
jgi:DNA-binding NtrC family response regulator